MMAYDEVSLHQDIIRTWGEHGAHNDVFTQMLTLIDRQRTEIEGLREQVRVQARGGLSDGTLAWVERTMTVDAIDPAKDALEANGGWHLLHVGMGAGGQTTLTYGWGTSPLSES